MNKKKYMEIIAYVESCLEKYGDTPQGVAWPKLADVPKRYEVTLDVIKPDTSGRVTLLDFGCGASHFYEYINRLHIGNIDYSGLDISQKFIDLSRHEFPPVTYYCVDILEDSDVLPDFDYVIMNGVFTAKITLSFDRNA